MMMRKWIQQGLWMAGLIFLSSCGQVGFEQGQVIQKFTGNPTDPIDPPIIEPPIETYSVFAQIYGSTGTLSLTRNGATADYSLDGEHEVLTSLESGEPVSLSIESFPSGQECEFSNSTMNYVDTIGNSDLYVSIYCSDISTPTYSIGGDVYSGTGTPLASNIVVNNIATGHSQMIPAGSTTFVLTEELEAGSSYFIQVTQKGSHANCNVNGGSGTISNYDITDIEIHCF